MKKLLVLLLGGAAVVGVGAVAIAQSPGVNSNYPVNWALPYSSPIKTYGAAIKQISPTSANSDDLFEICGAASKTIRINKITLTGRAAAVGPIDLALIKRSTVGTLSTAGVNKVPYSTAWGSASAVLYKYGTAQVVGTYVGAMDVVQYYLGNLTTGQSGTPQVWTFGNRPSSTPVLNTAAQCLGVSLSGTAAIGGNLYDVGIEWTEEP